jgi:hypothetical protein
MIRIEHVRLPGGLQAFARLEDDTVVVYVSAELSTAERTTAIMRALRAAPEAGWREPHRPVLLPALAGAARLRLVPESRWAYRGLAAVPAAVAAAVITLTLLGGGNAPASRGTAAPTMPPVTASPGPAGPPGTAHRKGPGVRPGSGSGSGSSATGSGPGGKAHGKTSGQGGSGPVPQGSGRPSPTPTPTKPGSPKPSPKPSPSPSPKGSGSCVSVLGITVCL